MGVANYHNFAGLNTKDEPWEILPAGADPREKPPLELRICSDYDVTNSNKLIVRSGRTLTNATAFTNLWRGEGFTLGVRGGFLCLISNDFTTYTQLQGGFGAERVSYVNFGGVTFFSTPSVNGYVRGGGAHSFPVPEDVLKMPIPAGQLVEIYKGRLLIASSATVFQTDPLAVRLAVDINPEIGGSSRQFGSPVTLLKAVGGGVWFGDSEGIWWGAGNNLADMKRVNKAGSVPILGLATRVQPAAVADRAAGIVWNVATNEGIYLLGEEGELKHLTYEKYTMPATTGGCMFYNKHQNCTITVLQK